MYNLLLPLLALGRRFRYVWCAALLLSSAATAEAQTRFFGLGTVSQPVNMGNTFFPAGANVGDQGIVQFDVNSGSPVVPSTGLVKVTGVPIGQTLVGIDYRPFNGVLYALGYNPSTSTAQLYTLNTGSGAVAVVGSPNTLNLGTDVARIGFDFNPVADRIRVVGTTGQNFRLNPNNGVLVATDTPLAYAAGDTRAGVNPGVGTVAYTNSTIGATTTELFDIDELNGAVLVSQNPPDNGTLNSIAALNNPASFVAFDTSLALDIDVYYNAATGTNRAFLVEVSTRNASGVSNSNVYDLNLATGATSNKRNMVPANSQTPFDVRDIAVPITPPVCAAPTNPAASSVGATTATIVFSINVQATTYTVTVTPATGAPTTQTTTGSPVSLTGLTPNTAYTVSIVSNCFGGLLMSPAASTTFTTTVLPTITSLSPSSATAGGPSFTLTVTGTDFINGATVNFNGVAQTTTFVSATQLTATIAASNIVTAGTYNVTVTNPSPSSGTSAPATFTVNNLAPTVTNLSPASVTAGAAAQTLTVNGTNFLTTSVVNFNGLPRPTTFFSATLLTIALSAADQSTAGSYPVTVSNPAPGGGTSNPVNFTVNPGACLAPSNLVAGSVTSTSATVTFTGSGTATGYTVTTSPATTTQTLGASSTSVSFSGLTPSTQYAVSIVSNCAGGTISSPATVTFTTTAAPLTDLMVNTAQNVQGNYRNVTVVAGGTATLTGGLGITGVLQVQTGGALNQNCQPVTGAGQFELQAGGTLLICDAAGISASGPSGAILVTGTRTLSPGASYTYNGTVAQVTGPGLPAQVLNLTVANAASVTLSQAVAVAQLVRLSAGNLTTGGQAFTLLSSAAGTALVDNAGGVVNGTATVQRYIAPNLNAGLGYRHYSSPVASTTVADLTASGFTPVVNAQYNTLGNTVTTFPTVFGYDETRVTTSGGAGAADFDKGYFSPTNLTDVLVPTRGYTVNIPASALVDFVGTLNNGTLTATGLTRGGQTKSGFHLRGNPYPSPLNWSALVANGRLSGVDNALYVFKSSGQYTGAYAGFVNNVSVNGGTNIIPLGQGFFVRASTTGAAGSLTFTNQERLTTFDSTPFQRGAGDARPQLVLALHSPGATTQTAVYFQQGATAGFDRAFDAYSLAAPNGLTLATEAGPESLVINGLPVLAGTDVLVPLQVASRTAGTFTLAVDALVNVPATYHVYLRDALSGTYTDLTTTPSVSLALTANSAAGGRYAVLFTTQARVLASASAALAQLASVYPNPARGSATLLLPTALRGTQATAVSVVDNLGRVVLTRTLAAGTAETLELPLAGLAPGVYSVQAHTAAGLVAKRLMVQ